MNLEILSKFFMWSTIVNFGFMFFALIMLTIFKKRVYKIHSKMFGISEKIIAEKVYSFLTNYKIMVMIFALVPYITIEIIK